MSSWRVPPKGMLLMQYLILAPRQTAEAKTLMQVMWPEEKLNQPRYGAP